MSEMYKDIDTADFHLWQAKIDKNPVDLEEILGRLKKLFDGCEKSPVVPSDLEFYCGKPINIIED